MKKKDGVVIILGLCLGLFLTTIGCNISIGNWPQARYERTAQQQVPLASGSTLVTETSFGSITVAGADVTDCNVTANIFAQAPTEQEAQELADQVQIKLEQTGNILTVTAEKPHVGHNRSIGVSFNIIVPKQTSVECSSSYGAIELSNLQGNLKGKTSSGKIKSENIQGSTQLVTSYGSITCKKISGDSIYLKSSSGSINIENIRGSTELFTSYGDITCNDFSDGDINLKTSSGRIILSKASLGNCDAHTSYGSVTCEELKGNLIKLHSGNGNISVTNTSAKSTTDISTSYGRITCREITTPELIAKSSNGSIDINFSESAPSEINAEAITSYGNIDFVTPKGFSGQVEMSTSYGSIKTELPVTITGEISKKNIAGTIGEGKGKIHLRTSSGSIKIR
jgi:DUF4097 and DUF4098 domain-containing protein YvlB